MVFIREGLIDTEPGNRSGSKYELTTSVTVSRETGFDTTTNTVLASYDIRPDLSY